MVKIEPGEVENGGLSLEVQRLLMNKFVMVLGDSNHRSVYKDLVLLLQRNDLMTESETRTKGELTFHNDILLEGGVKGRLNNGINYTEVRQYFNGCHLVKFYFVTRCYSNYVESILKQICDGPAPDLFIMNSCLWDLTRYGPNPIYQYRDNMEMLCGRLIRILGPDTLVIWTTTLPISKQARGGFLTPQVEYRNRRLTAEVLEANYEARNVVINHGFSVLDLHYWFRNKLQLRKEDGVHWCAVAHRFISELLLTNVAYLWDMPFPPISTLPVNYPFIPKEPQPIELDSLIATVQQIETNWWKTCQNTAQPYRRPAPYHVPAVRSLFPQGTQQQFHPGIASFNTVNFNCESQNTWSQGLDYNGLKASSSLDALTTSAAWQVVFQFALASAALAQGQTTAVSKPLCSNTPNCNPTSTSTVTSTPRWQSTISKSHCETTSTTKSSSENTPTLKPPSQGSSKLKPASQNSSLSTTADGKPSCGNIPISEPANQNTPMSVSACLSSTPASRARACRRKKNHNSAAPYPSKTAVVSENQNNSSKPCCQSQAIESEECSEDRVLSVVSSDKQVSTSKGSPMTEPAKLLASCQGKGTKLNTEKWPALSDESSDRQTTKSDASSESLITKSDTSLVNQPAKSDASPDSQVTKSSSPEDQATNSGVSLQINSAASLERQVTKSKTSLEKEATKPTVFPMTQTIKSEPLWLREYETPHCQNNWSISHCENNNWSMNYKTQHCQNNSWSTNHNYWTQPSNADSWSTHYQNRHCQTDSWSTNCERLPYQTGQQSYNNMPPCEHADYRRQWSGPPAMTNNYRPWWSGPSAVNGDYKPQWSGPSAMNGDYKPQWSGPPAMNGDYKPQWSGPPAMNGPFCQNQPSNNGPINPNIWNMPPQNFTGFTMPRGHAPCEFYNDWSDYNQDRLVGAHRHPVGNNRAGYCGY